MKNLHNSDVCVDCLARIEKLSETSRPLWGSMTAAQMLAHCADIREVTNGKALENTPLFVKLFGRMIRKMVLSEKPYRRDSRTHPQYRQNSQRDFESEKRRLLDSLDQFIRRGCVGQQSTKRPLFGKMKAEENGWATYKRMDHHLTQFGA